MASSSVQSPVVITAPKDSPTASPTRGSSRKKENGYLRRNRKGGSQSPAVTTGSISVSSPVLTEGNTDTPPKVRSKIASWATQFSSQVAKTVQSSEIRDSTIPVLTLGRGGTNTSTVSTDCSTLKLFRIPKMGAWWDMDLADGHWNTDGRDQRKALGGYDLKIYISLSNQKNQISTNTSPPLVVVASPEVVPSEAVHRWKAEETGVDIGKSRGKDAYTLIIDGKWRNTDIYVGVGMKQGSSLSTELQNIPFTVTAVPLDPHYYRDLGDAFSAVKAYDSASEAYSEGISVALAVQKGVRVMESVVEAMLAQMKRERELLTEAASGSTSTAQMMNLIQKVDSIGMQCQHYTSLFHLGLITENSISIPLALSLSSRGGIFLRRRLYLDCIKDCNEAIRVLSDAGATGAKTGVLVTRDMDAPRRSLSPSPLFIKPTLPPAASSLPDHGADIVARTLVRRASACWHCDDWLSARADILNAMSLNVKSVAVLSSLVKEMPPEKKQEYEKILKKRENWGAEEEIIRRAELENNSRVRLESTGALSASPRFDRAQSVAPWDDLPSPQRDRNGSSTYLNGDTNPTNLIPIPPPPAKDPRLSSKTKCGAGCFIS